MSNSTARVDRSVGAAGLDPHGPRRGERGAIVLKFGSSVIPSEGALPHVVREIERWSQEHDVIAVVSAVGGATDALLAHARQFGSGGGPGGEHALAAYVATGEAQAVALLGLALARAGVSASVLDAGAIGLRTSGPALDGLPVGLDQSAVRRAMRGARVLVVPGFVGRDEEGRATLLGRGGSDLTALFIAQQLGARCRLVKDVDGLYDRDPALAGEAPARRFGRVSYGSVLAMDEGVVQHKAVRFARGHDLTFEVGALAAERATRVGAEEDAFECDAVLP